MTYEELLIDIDLKGYENVLPYIGKTYFDDYWFVVCDDGDCHLFGKNGREDDISKVKEIDTDMISRDIKKIIIPDNVMRIKDWAFSSCNGLKSVMIPANVNNIRNYAFCSCSELKSMTIPNNVMNIGKDIFIWCRNLKELIFKGKSLYGVESMKNYSFGIRDESIIKCN